MRRFILLAAVVGCIKTTSLWAQADKAPPEDPAHEQLRTFRQGIQDAFSKRDIDRLLEHLHPDVVVIWQNGEINRGRDAVKAYYQRMLLNENSRLETMTADLDVSELSIFYGKEKNTAIAFGTMEDSYKVRKSGFEFNLHSRWTTTLVKEGDRWLIVSAQASGNVFENEVLSLAIKKTTYWSAGIMLTAGVILGGIGGFFIRRRKHRTS